MSNAFQKDSKQHILACIDGSNVTKPVCDYATWYGEKLNLPVSLLHVIDIPKSNRHDLSGSIGMDSRKQLMNELTQLDKEQARIANKHGEALVNDAKTHIMNNSKSVAVSTYLRHGKLLPAIEHFSENSRVIIMGRRGQDHQNNNTPQSVNIGSQIESVVRALNRPILICSEPFKEPTSFMIAFDGSPTAKKAVDIMCKSELPTGLTGHIVMVGQKNSKHEQDLLDACEKLINAGLETKAHIVDAKEHNNDVVKALTDLQQKNNISLIVIGAYGHTKLRQFFVGSTTTKLLAKTTTPVLLLR